MTSNRSRATLDASATGTVDLALVRLAGALVAGLEIFAGVWLLVAPPEASQAPWGVVAALAMLGAVMALVAILGSDPPGRAWLIPISALIPFAALIWLRQSTGLSGFWAVGEILALAAGLSLMSARRVATQLGVLGVVILLMLIFSLPGADAVNALDHPAAAAFSMGRVIALSLAALALAVLLRTAARQIDRQRAQLQAAYLSQARLRAQEQAQNDIRAAIHDTVLNTLEAAAVGVPEQPITTLRVRYQQDLDRLERELDHPDQAAGDLSAVLSRWGEAGLVISSSVEEVARPPDDAVAAVVGAVDELLRNVSQHAGTDHVELSGHITANSIALTVTDRGDGFDPGTTERGIGLRNSVVNRIQSVGGRVQISSAVGSGTRVALTWNAPDVDLVQVTSFPPTDLVPALLRGLSGLVGLVAGLAAAALLITHASYYNWVWALVGISASLIVSAWLLYSVRRAPLQPIHAAMAILVSMVSPWALALAERYCSPGTASALPLDGRLLPLLVLLVLAPHTSWWLAALAASSLSALALVRAQHLLDADCGLGPLTAWVAVLVTATGGFLVGQVIQRQQAAADLVANDALHLRLNHEQTAAARTVRAQWQGPALSTAMADLTGLAQGRLDPRDPATRSSLRVHAGRLRAAVVAGQVSGTLGVLLQQVADVCAEQGIELEFQVPGNDVLPLPAADSSSATVSALQWLQSSDAAVLATVAGGSDWGSLLLQHPSDTSAEPIVVGHSSLTITQWGDGDAVFWHAQWG